MLYECEQLKNLSDDLIVLIKVFRTDLILLCVF